MNFCVLQGSSGS